MTPLRTLSDQISNSITLLEILPIYGIEVDEKGVGRCPFRDRHKNGDKHPSLKYDAKSRRLFCNSARCFDFEERKGVDLFAFVQVMEQCSFQTALQILAKKLGMQNPTTGTGDELTSCSDELEATTRYPYKDSSGELMFTIHRHERGSTKRFRVDPAGIKPEERILYRLPDLMQGRDPVVVV